MHCSMIVTAAHLIVTFLLETGSGSKAEARLNETLLMPLGHSALPYALWIAGNLAFLVPLYGLARRKASGPQASLVQALILYFALVEGVVFLLALFGALTPTSNIIVLSACGLALWVWHLRVKSREYAPISSEVTAAAEPWAATAGVALLFALFLAIAVTRAAITGDTTTDGLWYHLPRVYGLLQEQSLAPLGHPTVDAYHPKGAEFWFYWNFVLFGSPGFTVVSLLPFLLLALAATFSLARSFGVSSTVALTGALTAAFTPVLAAQLGTTYTDIMTAALIVAALSLVNAPTAKMNRFDRCCLALCLGLLLNSKLSALVTAPVIGAYFLWIESKRSSPLAAFRQSICVLLLAAAFGGYTYVDNFVRYGNPLYPQDFTLGPITFQGLVAFERMWEMRDSAGESAITRAIGTWLSPGEVSYASVKGGYGVAGLILLPVLLASSILALARSNSQKLRALLLCSALLYFLTPLFFVPRYTLFIIFVGGACLAVLLQHLPRSGYTRVVVLSLTFLSALFAIAQQLTLLQKHGSSARALSPTCPAFFPESYRPVFEMAQRREPSPQTWLVVGELDPIALACFWDPSFQNRAYFFQLEGHHRSLSDVRAEARTRQVTHILIPKPLAEELPVTTVVLTRLTGAVVVDDSLYKLQTEQ